MFLRPVYLSVFPRPHLGLRAHALSLHALARALARGAYADAQEREGLESDNGLCVPAASFSSTGPWTVELLSCPCSRRISENSSRYRDFI